MSNGLQRRERSECPGRAARLTLNRVKVIQIILRPSEGLSTVLAVKLRASPRFDTQF
jgi:hypothetical protein